MHQVNEWALAAATVAVFVLSSVWYMAFAKQMAELHPAYAPGASSMSPGKVAVELLRSLVVAAVLAGLMSELGIAGWVAAAHLALVLWVAFPVVLWTGAVMWEKVPPKLAIIHAGDWLLKLLVISTIISLWR